MKTSERTKNVRKLGILFKILSWLCCFGFAVVFIIICMSGSSAGDETMREKLGTVVYGIGISLIPMIVLAIIVKDKIRPTVWMVDVILANYLFGSTLMYIVFAVWLIDEYVIGPLGRRYMNLYTINKEIDRR